MLKQNNPIGKSLGKVAFFLLALMACSATYAQGTPSDYYYNQQMNSVSSTASQSPSEVYYNHNLRSGAWDDDGGPGGSGEGGNAGVVVPVGQGAVCIAIAALLYGALIAYKRNQHEKRRFRQV